MTTMAATGEALDQLSTSHTNPDLFEQPQGVTDANFSLIRSEIHAARDNRDLVCENGAPYIFFVDKSGRAHLVQGCCNDWTCVRCGQLRALHEYGRLVNGARVLGELGESLYFVTFTCRGRELSAREADAGYLTWTDKLLTACRNKQTRAGLTWSYASVTERQKRGHPHSHYITTFCSDDVEEFQTGAMLPNGTKAKHDTLYSPWLEDAAIRAGLGRMVDASFINSPVAVAVYAAKYMFKEAVNTVWPRGWKRVRYSNNWPKLPKPQTEVAFPLLHFADWLRMDRLGYVVHADSERTVEAARARSIACVR